MHKNLPLINSCSPQPRVKSYDVVVDHCCYAWKPSSMSPWEFYPSHGATEQTNGIAEVTSPAASPAGPEWHDAPSSIARFGIVHLRKALAQTRTASRVVMHKNLPLINSCSPQPHLQILRRRRRPLLLRWKLSSISPGKSYPSHGRDWANERHRRGTF
jgi:hypothetical protein